MSHLHRRSFLAAGAAGVPLLSSLGAAGAAQERRGPPRRPVVVASANGLPAVVEAMRRLGEGRAPVEAVVAGVTLIEDDPEDTSVGLGGLPNEQGVVELDASVMDGPSHKAGAVAALRHIRNPSQVALRVLQRTDHVLLVGEGALQFARAHGFKEENLLTDKARAEWLRWKESLSPEDDWLDPGQQVGTPAAPVRPASKTTGTVHCAAVNEAGDVGACTSTSGLSYKLPGRVGDSPIVGAGMFVDNAVGAAGSTGRGESVIKSCGAFQVVRHMESGLDPTEACLRVLKWIADHTRRAALLNARGEPDFNVIMYALRRDGAHGSACMRGARRYAVHDGAEARLLDCTPLFQGD